MDFQLESESQKHIIGIEIKTSNLECQHAIPSLWNRFYAEQIASKIPGRKGRALYALYTDYEGDASKPYSYIIGCEVESLATIPPGMVGKTVPSSSYAVLKPEGQFPTNVQNAWEKVWTSDIKRKYTTDFELYPSDFHPVTNPNVQLFIAIDKH